MLFSKPWFQEKVILVSLPGGRHRFSSWLRWLGCCSNPAVRNRQRKTVDFQRVKKTAKWNIEVWKSSYLQGIWAWAPSFLGQERAGRMFVCVIFPFQFWDLLLIYHITCPPAFWPFKFWLICTNSNFSATGVGVYPLFLFPEYLLHLIEAADTADAREKSSGCCSIVKCPWWNIFKFAHPLHLRYHNISKGSVNIFDRGYIAVT